MGVQIGLCIINHPLMSTGKYLHLSCNLLGEHPVSEQGKLCEILNTALQLNSNVNPTLMVTIINHQ